MSIGNLFDLVTTGGSRNIAGLVPGDQATNNPTAAPQNQSQRFSQNFLNFLGQNPGQADFLNRGIGRINFNQAPNLRAPGASLNANLTAFGASGLPLGFANLNQMLANQGRTDPRILNRQLTSIDRGTEANQQALTSRLSRAGLQNSGVGAAVAAALDAAGGQQRAGAISRDIEQSEARKRQDLQLLQQLFIDPSTDFEALGLGQFNADRSRNDQQTAAFISALGSIFGGLGSGGGGG